MNEDFDGIKNMTDKEAAIVLKRLRMNIQLGRRNGKTMYILSVNRAMQKAIEALEEKARREEEEKSEERQFIEYIKENTISGFSFDDLKQLALALHKTGLTPEDLKDQNKVFISGAEYAINEVAKRQAQAIEDALIGCEDKSEKNIEEAKKAAQRWGAQHEPKSIQAELRNMINRYYDNKGEEK